MSADLLTCPHCGALVPADDLSFHEIADGVEVADCPECACGGMHDEWSDDWNGGLS